MLVALVIFGLSSVAASRMTTANELILMRAVMGVSGAFIMPISLAVLPTIFSEQERPRAIAIGGAGMFLGLPLGPLVAGWLLTHYEWGSIFLINAPIVVVALIGVWLFIPESRDSNAPRLDFVGAGPCRSTDDAQLRGRQLPGSYRQTLGQGRPSGAAHEVLYDAVLE